WFAREVLEALGDAFKIGDEPVFLSASIGISIAPLDTEDGETLLANAHSALDHAREQGPGNFQFFSAERAATALRRLEMENRLRRAIEDDELALHYQPQVSLPSGAIHGVEALIRWQHPALGPVPPETFMEVAGEAGLLPEIGDWVLRRSLGDLAEWTGRGIAPIHVSVNVSADLMRRGHVTEMALDALAESGVDAGRLTLELTESVILEDLDAAIEAMGLLRGYGIRFALDDFGTGYSALSYLKALPFDCLKVDRSFVQDIETSAEARAVIRAIIGMAKTLNMVVAAEGVESEGQLERLIEEGCDLYQGFLCSEPLPADGLLGFLKEWPERQRLHHAD
ncbi:MAG: GGDEF domain-containing phosphodiesterase, partial [Sphingomonadales bacterium]|nr:GGDEF domain-containing phosphodiesterase [Sphingomonadales bacterium]